MEWRCLTEEELAELCDTALLQDFPAAELRPKAATLKMLRRGVYRPWGVFVSESDMPGCPPMERLAAYLLIACPLLTYGVLRVTKQDLLPKARDEEALARRP